MDFEDIIWFAVVFWMITSVGKCTFSAIRGMDDDGTVTKVERPTEYPEGAITPEGKLKKKPAPEIVAPPTPAPILDNPELKVETHGNCEIVGTINFLCTNKVKLGDKWYTVKTECDRDPYDDILTCEIK